MKLKNILNIFNTPLSDDDSGVNKCDKKHVLDGKVKGIIQNGGKEILPINFNEEDVIDGTILRVSDGSKPTYDVEFTDRILTVGDKDAEPIDLPYLREFETTEPLYNNNYYVVSANGPKSESCLEQQEFNLEFRVDVEQAEATFDGNGDCVGTITYEFKNSLEHDYNLYFFKCDSFKDLMDSPLDGGKNPDMVLQTYYEKHESDSYPDGKYPEIKNIEYFDDDTLEIFNDEYIWENAWKEYQVTYDDLSNGIYYLIAINNKTGVRTYSQPIDMRFKMEVLYSNENKDITIVNAGEITTEPEEGEDGEGGEIDGGVITFNEEGDIIKPLYSCHKHKYNIKLWVNEGSGYQIAMEGETSTRYKFEDVRIVSGADMRVSVEDVTGLVKYFYFTRQ